MGRLVGYSGVLSGECNGKGVDREKVVVLRKEEREQWFLDGNGKWETAHIGFLQ